MSFDLITATQDFVVRERIKLPTVPHLRPTEASVCFQKDGKTVVLGSCLRAVYWRYTGLQGTPSSFHLQMTAELGKSCELMLIELWKQMGIFIDAHVRFQSKQYNLSGEIDVVLRNPETGIVFGTEVKSFYGYHAQKEILGNKSQAGQPKDKHLLQTLIYTRECQGVIDHFVLPYIERGDGRLKGYYISALPDEENGEIIYRPQVNGDIILDYTVDDIYKRYAQLLKYVDTKTLPAREFIFKYSNERIDLEYENDNISKSAYEAFKKIKKDGTVVYNERERPGDWQCAYCPFRRICYTDKGEPID